MGKPLVVEIERSFAAFAPPMVPVLTLSLDVGTQEARVKAGQGGRGRQSLYRPGGGANSARAFEIHPSSSSIRALILRRFAGFRSGSPSRWVRWT